MFPRNSLNFVNNLCLIVLVLLRRIKIQSPVLKKCHVFAFLFSINQSEHVFESEFELSFYLATEDQL